MLNHGGVTAASNKKKGRVTVFELGAEFILFFCTLTNNTVSVSRDLDTCRIFFYIFFPTNCTFQILQLYGSSLLDLLEWPLSMCKRSFPVHGGQLVLEHLSRDSRLNGKFTPLVQKFQESKLINAHSDALHKKCRARGSQATIGRSPSFMWAAGCSEW